jgi:tetratricopeptide (TPR) repeat protein
LKIARVWAQVAYDYQDEGAFASAEAAYVRSLAELSDVPEAASVYATILDNFGSLYLMMGRLQEAENCRRKSLEMKTKLGDPLDIERSRALLAEVALARHQWKDAEKQASEAAQQMIVLKDKQKTDIISTFAIESYAQSLEGKQQDAILSAKHKVAIASDSFPLQSLLGPIELSRSDELCFEILPSFVLAGYLHREQHNDPLQQS